jgi:hypothetical protein
MISSDSDDENWEVTEAGRFDRLGRARGLRGRHFLEALKFRKVKRFEWLGRSKFFRGRPMKSGNLGGREVWKDWQDPLAGNECIFATCCRLCKLPFR